MAGASSTQRLLVVAALVGLAVRLAFGLGYWVDKTMTRDEREYLSLARSLAAGHGFVYDDEIRTGPVDPFGRAPGYPAFLALAGGGRSVVTSVPPSVKIAQSIVGAIGVFLIGRIALRLAGDRAAVATAAVAAVYPPLVWIAAYAYSEAVFWTLGLALALLFDRVVDVDSRRGWRLALAFGALVGIAVLVRAATLVFVPLAGAWLLWKHRPLTLAWCAVGLLVVLGPWTARNYAHHGRFVLVASDGGVTFWTGNHPLATGEGDMAANPALKIASQELRARHPDLNEEQMEPVYYREAFAWIRAHPFDWIALEFRKLFYLVVPVGPSYTLHSRLYYGVTVVSVGVLLPAAAIGLWRLGPRRARTTGLWLLALSAVAICLIFFPQERFRIPVIDPALIVCTSGVWLLGGPARWTDARTKAA